MSASDRGGAGATSRRERSQGWPPPFAVAGRDRRAALVLAHLRGITPRQLLRLANEEGTASACLARIVRGGRGTERDKELAASADPGALAAAVGDAGARFVPVGDPGYPDPLLDLDDPPLGIFVRGRDPAAPAPGGGPVDRVAIVGARACTPYGLEVAADLGRGLGAAGVCVVSGAARGIDAAAHRGALDGGGWTIAVLGSGVDVAYPVANRPLLEEIARGGTVISEYPPGTPAEAYRFPARNRIVAALARALIVVEGAPGSGSMISVDHATDCGREVLAVPGPVTSPLSEVPLELIRGGAAMVRGPADVLEELGRTWPGTIGGLGTAAGGEGPGHAAGTGIEATLLAALGGVPRDVQGLVDGSGRPLPEVLAALLRLEMRGLARRVGGRYQRTMLARR